MSGSGSDLKVGVFGGTFDPIHLGHLVKAEEARETLCLDQVLFIPAGQPWLKADRQITAAHHRTAMVQLAITSNARFRESPIEVTRDGPSYTVDTLEELTSRIGPDAELHLIVGTDALQEIERWRQPERLFGLAMVAAVARPDRGDFDARFLDRISPGASNRVRMIEGVPVGISGTDIRRRVAAGQSIKYLVPEPVEEYIYQHGLYGAGTSADG